MPFLRFVLAQYKKKANESEKNNIQIRKKTYESEKRERVREVKDVKRLGSEMILTFIHTLV